MSGTPDEPKLRHNLDLDALMKAVDRARWAKSITIDTPVRLRDVCDATGVSISYLTELRNGAKTRPSSATLLSLLAWLELPDDQLGALVRTITTTR